MLFRKSFCFINREFQVADLWKKIEDKIVGINHGQGFTGAKGLDAMDRLRIDHDDLARSSLVGLGIYLEPVN